MHVPFIASNMACARSKQTEQTIAMVCAHTKQTEQMVRAFTEKTRKSLSQF